MGDVESPRSRRCAERQAENAGSEETDNQGRRIDDREFTETRNMLCVLKTAAMGRYHRRDVFPDDLIGGVYHSGNFTTKGLPEQISQRLPASAHTTPAVANPHSLRTSNSKTCGGFAPPAPAKTTSTPT